MTKAALLIEIPLWSQLFNQL